MGVILNRPHADSLEHVLPGWERWAAEPAVLFLGGPVGDGSGVCLTTDAHGRPELVDLNVDPTDVEAPRHLRIFIGFAGWGADQLESELGAGAWVVAEALPGDLTTPRPSHLWREVLRRQGGRTAWLANVPADLTVN